MFHLQKIHSPPHLRHSGSRGGSTLPTTSSHLWGPPHSSLLIVLVGVRAFPIPPAQYFLSNQNVAVNMRQVYDEHEYWRQYENVQWAQWDAFFARASAWALEHEEQSVLGL